jgi:hypothetical protein
MVAAGQPPERASIFGDLQVCIRRSYFEFRKIILRVILIVDLMNW